MKELELRYKLNEEDFNDIHLALERMYGFGVKEKHRDMYFLQKFNKTFDDGNTWLSLRKRNGKGLLNLKRYEIDSHKNRFSWENEIKISSIEEGQLILGFLGFKKVTEIIKTRYKFSTMNNVIICLDKVENLGLYLEIENNESQETSLFMKEVDQILMKLNITKDKQVIDGYAKLKIINNLSK